MRRCIILVTAFTCRTLTERIQYGYKYLQVVKHPLARFRLLHARTCCLPEASYMAGCSSCLTNHCAYHFPPAGRVHVLRLNSMGETKKTTGGKRETAKERERGRTRWSCWRIAEPSWEWTHVSEARDTCARFKFSQEREREWERRDRGRKRKSTRQKRVSILAEAA